MADLLGIIVHVEQARWDEAKAISDRYGIPQRAVSKCYIESLVGANKLLG